MAARETSRHSIGRRPVMSARISKKCSVLAFYDWEERPDAYMRFYNSALDWLRELDYEPNYLSVKGQDFKTKVGKFQRIDANIRKRGLECMRGFSLFSILPDPPPIMV